MVFSNKWVLLLAVVIVLSGVLLILRSDFFKKEKDTSNLSIASAPEENLQQDSDEDGFVDWLEITTGTDPNDSRSFPEEQHLAESSPVAEEKVVHPNLPPVEEGSIVDLVVSESLGLSKNLGTPDVENIEQSLEKIESSIKEKIVTAPPTVVTVVREDADTAELVRVLNQVQERSAEADKKYEPEITLVSRVINNDENARADLISLLNIYEENINDLKEVAVKPALAEKHKALLERFVVVRDALRNFVVASKDLVVLLQTLDFFTKEVKGEEDGEGVKNLRQLFDELYTTALSG